MRHNAYTMEPNETANPEPEKELNQAAEAPVEETGEAQGEEYAEEPEQSQSVPEMAYSWEASEFVHHHKSMLWYAVMWSAIIALAAIAVWLHLWLEIGVFVLMGIAILVYASKAPRTLLYELGPDGIHIDGKLYAYTAFRSFSVSQEPEWHSVDLEPVKRFSPRVVMLYDPEDYDPIVGHLEVHLPREDREPDMIEKITRAVRF